MFHVIFALVSLALPAGDVVLSPVAPAKNAMRGGIGANAAQAGCFVLLLVIALVYSVLHWRMKL